MKRKETRLAHGGLYRCCIQSYFDWAAAGPELEVEDGERIRCTLERGEPERMIVAERGVVRWFHPEDGKP